MKNLMVKAGSVLALACCFLFNSASSLQASELKGVYLEHEYLKIPFSTFSDGVVYQHLNLTRGTVEFWVKADWDWYARREDDVPLFFWGEQGNRRCIRIHKRTTPQIDLAVVADNYKWLISRIEYGRGEARDVYDLKPGSWHHVAAWWDTEAGKEERGMFLDGKKVLMNTRTNIPERVFDGITELYYDMYIGATKDFDGAFKADVPPMMTIAEFRISNTVRYQDEFTPAERLSVDEHTLLYAPFDVGLEGQYYRRDDTPGTMTRIEKIKVEE